MLQIGLQGCHSSAYEENLECYSGIVMIVRLAKDSEALEIFLSPQPQQIKPQIKCGTARYRD